MLLAEDIFVLTANRKHKFFLETFTFMLSVVVCVLEPISSQDLLIAACFLITSFFVGKKWMRRLFNLWMVPHILVY